MQQTCPALLGESTSRTAGLAHQWKTTPLEDKVAMTGIATAKRAIEL